MSRPFGVKMASTFLLFFWCFGLAKTTKYQMQADVQTGYSYLHLLQEMAGGWTANQREKTRVKGKKEVGVEAAQKPLQQEGNFCFQITNQTMFSLSDQPSSRPASACYADETDKMKRSSVRPIRSSSPSPSTPPTPPTGRSPQGRTQPKTSHQAFMRNQSSQYQVGFSSLH